jgi:hypothetical protein
MEFEANPILCWRGGGIPRQGYIGGELGRRVPQGVSGSQIMLVLTGGTECVQVQSTIGK